MKFIHPTNVEQVHVEDREMESFQLGANRCMIHRNPAPTLPNHANHLLPIHPTPHSDSTIIHLLLMHFPWIRLKKILCTCLSILDQHSPRNIYHSDIETLPLNGICCILCFVPRTSQPIQKVGLSNSGISLGKFSSKSEAFNNCFVTIFSICVGSYRWLIRVRSPVSVLLCLNL